MSGEPKRGLLVTGATGCVGRAVVDRALADGWRVRGLARRAPSAALPAGVELLLGAVEDRRAVARAIDGVEAVVHLAAYVHAVPHGAAAVSQLRRVIVEGTQVVAEAARNARARLISASTVAVYGSRPPAPCDERSAVHPDTPYAQAKLEAERLVSRLDPDATILRIAVVYGPHDRGNLLTLVRGINRGLAVTVGRGDNRKSVIYVENLAARISRALESATVPGVWVAADAPAPTQRELIERIAAALGRRVPPRVPQAPLAWVARGVDVARAIARRPGPSWHARVVKLSSPTEFDGRGLDDRLGYSAQVPLEEGIRRTVSWYREHGRG